MKKSRICKNLLQLTTLLYTQFFASCTPQSVSTKPPPVSPSRPPAAVIESPVPAGPGAQPSPSSIPETPEPFPYKAPAGLLAQLGTIHATYIVTNSLLNVDETKLRSYCKDLSTRGYNLAFVNVQARGYYLNKKGVLINTPAGNVLYPGHPAMQVLNPVTVLRSECSKQTPPVAIVPWFEYNAMAEQDSSYDNPLRGRGYNEKGELVSVKVYNEGSDHPTAYLNSKQTFFPSSWYLKKIGSPTAHVSNGLRWLDARQAAVTNFLFNFAQAVADDYGPLQNWDRFRFAADAGLGLEAERANKNNAQTRFVQRISSMLKSRGGALWATVVKHGMDMQKQKQQTVLFNETYGQYWATEAWAKAVQLFIPMTYFETFTEYQNDLIKIIQESQTLKFKFIPIIGLDRDIYTMRREFASLLQQQRDYTKLKISTAGVPGYADWYYWPY